MTLIFLYYTGKLSFIPQCFSNRTHHKNIYTSLKKREGKKNLKYLPLAVGTVLNVFCLESFYFFVVVVVLFFVLTQKAQKAIFAILVISGLDARL